MPRWLYKNLSDENLMRAYAGGRARAFDCLYERHRTRLFSFIRRQCGSDAIAEELVQDAWLAVIRQAKNYSPQAKFTTWLFRIAQNRLIDHWRKFGATANVVTEELTDRLAGSCRTSSDAELEDLFAVLQDLPPEQLTTMLLKIEGFSRQEIAEITSCKQETVKSRLRYAKNHLKEALEVSA